MFSAHSSWGIDFSDGTLKAVRLSRRRGRLVVQRAVRVPYAGPGEAAGPPRAGLGEAEREALLRLLHEIRLRSADMIVLGFPSAGVFQRVITLPPLGQDRLEEAARFEAINLLNEPLEDVVLRYRVLRGRTESEIPALCAAVRRERLDGLVSDLRRIGLDPDRIELEPLAAASFIERDQTPQAPYLAVQVGRLRIDLVFGLQRGIWTRTLPFGAGRLMRSVANQEKKAHELAVLALARRVARETYNAMAQTFGSAAAWRARTILLLGEGAVVPGLDRALGHFLGRTPVSRVDEFGHFRLGREIPDSLAPSIPRWGTALGLALSGLGRAPLGLSLVPVNRARAARRLVPRTSLAALAAGVLLLALTSLAQQRRSTLTAVPMPPADILPDAMARTFKELRDGFAKVAAPVRRLGRLGAERRRLAGTIEGLLVLFPLPGPTGRGVARLESVSVRRARDQDTLLRFEARVDIGGEDASAWPAYLRRRLREIDSLTGIAVTDPVRRDAPPGMTCTVHAQVRPIR